MGPYPCYFNTLYLLGVRFTDADGLDDWGELYSYDYDDDRTYFDESDLDDGYFYYDSKDLFYDEDFTLDDLTFVADRDADGKGVELDFTAYGEDGDKAYGTVAIAIGDVGGTGVAAEGGDIRYYTDYSGRVQINANDIARFFEESYPGYTLQYVTFKDAPTYGSLYYNYYGTSQFGATSRTQLTASSVSGKVFSYSPSAKTEYALSELTYIPSGTNYCTAIGFTAYGGSGQSYTGSILISVSTQAVSEIYSVTTKGTSVSFPATAISSAVSGATGASLSSIQLLDLPATTSGVVYYGSSMANTTSQYAYANLSQLRFVPNSNFTGSVSIPYVALNSNGVAFAAGTFSIGVVSSVKKFSDVTTSTWFLQIF